MVVEKMPRVQEVRRQERPSSSSSLLYQGKVGCRYVGVGVWCAVYVCVCGKVCTCMCSVCGRCVG